MKRVITSSMVLVALFAACDQLLAQTKVRPFEPPPRFKETSPPSPLLRDVKTEPQTCDPQGSISRDGNIVSVALKLIRADFIINNPEPSDPYKGEDPVTLRSYGGCKSGPVIDVLPGNTLRVELTNALDANDPSCQLDPPPGLSLPPGVGCFNTTNLHTHGLHVSPAGNSDNVLLDINPQTVFPYEINLPSDHPAGTFWYHAHRHGSTAVQVASGASGVLIVRGTRPYTPPTPQNPRPIADIDTILRDARGGPMTERLFLFQQIPYACFENDPKQPGGPWQKIHTTAGLYDVNSNNSDPKSPANAPWTCSPPARGVIENFALQLDSPTIWDTNGRFTSINGVVQPRLTIEVGEIQRWRFVHAGIHDTLNLQVVRAKGAPNLSGNRQQQKTDVAASCAATPETLIPQFEIAADGLTRAHMRTYSGLSGSGSIPSNYLQPGYRSDVLIAFPEEGDYCLLDQASPPAMSAKKGGRGQGPGGQGPSTPQLLAYIHVKPQKVEPQKKPRKLVTGDLEAYVRNALYDRNEKLPSAVRNGLKTGDLTPWAPFIDLPPAPAGNEQTADFAITGVPNNPPLFQINGQSYDPNVVNITRQVNTIDDWVLTSEGEPHIFHIHVNPFQVVDVTQTVDGKQVSIFDANGNCKKSMAPDPQGLVSQYCSMYRTFRDTVFVENGYQVHIRTRYDRYIGEFVIHCHILDHEDGGMMLNINIVPSLKSGMGAMKHRQ